VEEVDTNEEGIGWSEFLRVQIRINIMKQLARGWMLKLRDWSIWIPFKDEKNPKILLSLWNYLAWCCWMSKEFYGTYKKRYYGVRPMATSGLT
jgi:hypothetical protein